MKGLFPRVGTVDYAFIPFKAPAQPGCCMKWLAMRLDHDHDHSYHRKRLSELCSGLERGENMSCMTTPVGFTLY